MSGSEMWLFGTLMAIVIAINVFRLRLRRKETKKWQQDDPEFQRLPRWAKRYVRPDLPPSD
jgi:hypothetical protein